MNIEESRPEIADPNLSEYDYNLRLAAMEKKDENIPNSTMSHAELGIWYLINSAGENATIRIVSEQFYSGFWSKLQKKIELFLKEKNGNIKVILLKGKNSLIENLQAKFKNNVQVRVNGTLKDKISHFIAIEPVGYRIELSDDQIKDNLVKGIINFGDKKGTADLTKTFELLWETSEKE